MHINLKVCVCAVFRFIDLIKPAVTDIGNSFICPDFLFASPHFGSGGNFRFLFFSLICRSLSISPFSVFCAVLPAFTSIQIFTSPSHRLKRFSVFSLYRFHSLLYIYPRHNVPRTIYCWGSLAIGLTYFLFNLCLSALTAFPYPCRF